METPHEYHSEKSGLCHAFLGEWLAKRHPLTVEIRILLAVESVLEGFLWQKK